MKESRCQSCCRKTTKVLKYFWRNLPIGGIKLPLFYKKNDTFSSSLSKVIGVVLLLMALSYTFYEFSNYGKIFNVIMEQAKFKCNDDLAKKYDTIIQTDFFNMPIFVLWHRDKKIFDVCPQLEKMSMLEGFYYKFDIWWKPKDAAEHEDSYKRIPQEGRLECYNDTGLNSPNNIYSFFKLPNETRKIVLDLLEHEYEEGHKEESPEVQKLYQENNITADAVVKVSYIQAIYNGRKLCDEHSFGYSFVTNKQHVNMDYRAKFDTPPPRQLFDNYKQYVFED